MTTATHGLDPDLAHTVGFYVCPGHQILDLAGSLGAFDVARSTEVQARYEVQVLSRTGGSVVGSAGVVVETLPMGEAAVDTLVVVGGNIPLMCVGA